MQRFKKFFFSRNKKIVIFTINLKSKFFYSIFSIFFFFFTWCEQVLNWLFNYHVLKFYSLTTDKKIVTAKQRSVNTLNLNLKKNSFNFIQIFYLPPKNIFRLCCWLWNKHKNQYNSEFKSHLLKLRVKTIWIVVTGEQNVGRKDMKFVHDNIIINRHIGCFVD